jgi:4-amino-4-deoxy-L-arabinose transferase-like glycosyltransferase
MMMKHKLLSGSFLLSDLAILSYIALLKFLAQLLTSNSYGYFRDELYYIAASQRLALGYVDYPLFIAWLTAFVRATLGESLLALHFFPALAGALVVLLTGLMARELGGGRFAQVLAAVAVLFAPTFLAQNSMLTMDSFDELWWVLGIFIVLKILKHDRPQWWLWFGLVAGLGLLTKVTIAYLGVALVVGLLLTSARKYLLSKWLWLGGVIACLFLVPYLIWQAQNGWPTLEFWGTYAAAKTYPVTLLEFLLQQVVTLHPFAFPLAMVGVFAFLFAPALKPYRVFGWMYLLLFSLFAFQQAKNYFLAATYPVCFAAGAVMLERLAQAPRWSWLKPASLTLLIVGGLLAAPLALPVLPMETFIVYASPLGGDASVQTERLNTGNLPQHFADRFGWPELAETVGQVYQSLPPQEQAQVCLFTSNYGEAGALEFFGRGRLPRVISGHNSYHLWGPQGCDGSVMIIVGGEQAEIEAFFAEVELGAITQCRYCMPYENKRPIFVARHPKLILAQVWPQLKHFD